VGCTFLLFKRLLAYFRNSTLNVFRITLFYIRRVIMDYRYLIIFMCLQVFQIFENNINF